MAPKYVEPALGLDSFSCPHCGALAHQYWFRVLAKSFDRDKKPVVVDDMHLAALIHHASQDQQPHILVLKERFDKNEITYRTYSYSIDAGWEMVNLHLSRCHSCGGFTVWIKDQIAWPITIVEIEPNGDMPPDVKADFVEAASIVKLSPRGAAALARLALQKLMVDLGEKGKKLDDDIASLVKKGLDEPIRKALDVVRVIGNNAVHPGVIDLKDDAATATSLLQLVNLVVDRRISVQKRIDEMYAGLPPGALAAIEKRDR